VNDVENLLINTRKSILEVCDELMVEYHSEIEIRLKQCNCCGIWQRNMKLDLDGLDICTYCLDAYGA